MDIHRKYVWKQDIDPFITIIDEELDNTKRLLMNRFTNMRMKGQSAEKVSPPGNTDDSFNKHIVTENLDDVLERAGNEFWATVYQMKTSCVWTQLKGLLNRDDNEIVHIDIDNKPMDGNENYKLKCLNDVEINEINNASLTMEINTEKEKSIHQGLIKDNFTNEKMFLDIHDVLTHEQYKDDYKEINTFPMINIQSETTYLNKLKHNEAISHNAINETEKKNTDEDMTPAPTKLTDKLPQDITIGKKDVMSRQRTTKESFPKDLREMCDVSHDTVKDKPVAYIIDSDIENSCKNADRYLKNDKETNNKHLDYDKHTTDIKVTQIGRRRDSNDDLHKLAEMKKELSKGKEGINGRSKEFVNTQNLSSTKKQVESMEKIVKIIETVPDIILDNTDRQNGIHQGDLLMLKQKDSTNETVDVHKCNKDLLVKEEIKNSGGLKGFSEMRRKEEDEKMKKLQDIRSEREEIANFVRELVSRDSKKEFIEFNLRSSTDIFDTEVRNVKEKKKDFFGLQTKLEKNNENVISLKNKNVEKQPEAEEIVEIVENDLDMTIDETSEESIIEVYEGTGEYTSSIEKVDVENNCKNIYELIVDLQNARQEITEIENKYKKDMKREDENKALIFTQENMVETENEQEKLKHENEAKCREQDERQCNGVTDMTNVLKNRGGRQSSMDNGRYVMNKVKQELDRNTIIEKTKDVNALKDNSVDGKREKNGEMSPENNSKASFAWKKEEKLEVKVEEYEDNDDYITYGRADYVTELQRELREKAKKMKMSEMKTAKENVTKKESEERTSNQTIVPLKGDVEIENIPTKETLRKEKRNAMVKQTLEEEKVEKEADASKYVSDKETQSKEMTSSKERSTVSIALPKSSNPCMKKEEKISLLKNEEKIETRGIKVKSKDVTPPKEERQTEIADTKLSGKLKSSKMGKIKNGRKRKVVTAQSKEVTTKQKEKKISEQLKEEIADQTAIITTEPRKEIVTKPNDNATACSNKNIKKTETKRKKKKEIITSKKVEKNSRTKSEINVTKETKINSTLQHNENEKKERDVEPEKQSNTKKGIKRGKKKGRSATKENEADGSSSCKIDTDTKERITNNDKKEKNSEIIKENQVRKSGKNILALQKEMKKRADNVGSQLMTKHDKEDRKENVQAIEKNKMKSESKNKYIIRNILNVTGLKLEDLKRKGKKCVVEVEKVIILTQFI